MSVYFYDNHQIMSHAYYYEKGEETQEFYTFKDVVGGKKQETLFSSARHLKRSYIEKEIELIYSSWLKVK